MRVKLWLFALFCIGGGVVLNYMGVKDIVTTRKLAAEGKSAVATVVSRWERTVFRDNKSCHVTLTFQTEGGKRVTSELQVPREVYSGTTRGSSLNIRYYPKDPSVCSVGDQTELSYSRIIIGSVFAGLGVLLFVFLQRNPNAGDITPVTEDEIAEELRPKVAAKAKQVVKRIDLLTMTKHEYEAVDARKFTHLDLDYYDTQQRCLESLGFRYLQDSENVTLRNSPSNPNVFMRVMVRADGLTSAEFWHQQRIEQHIKQTGAQPLLMQCMADVQKQSDALWRLKALHRQRVGLTTEDWQRLSGGKTGDRASDLFYEEVMQEHRRTQEASKEASKTI
jgi:hypothetical protein